MIADFHFLRPWWLLAILAAIAILWLASRQSDMRLRWRDMIAPQLLDHLVSDDPSKGRLRPYHLTAMLIALAALALAGPTWQRELPPFVQDEAPLVIAIDLSQTMDAIDVTPSRLERAKLKVHDILAARPAARTAIIAYAGSAHLVLPLTDDAALVRTYVDSLATRIMPVAGKNTAVALAAAEKTLENGQAPGTILLMTDGVDAASFDQVARFGGSNNVVLLAIGTAEGGPVKTSDGGFASNAAGGRLFAKLDVDELKRLQSAGSISVATFTSDDSDVRWVVERIKTHFAQKAAEAETRWRDLGWWLTIPIMLLAALSFRRGWVVRWAGALVALHLIFSPDTSSAADLSLADMWLTPDQQGRLAYERGDYPAAAAAFRDNEWRGVALYRAGKFSEAVDAFAARDTPEAWYNQGNALLHLNRLDQAVAAYKRALQLRTDWPDARANLAIAEKLVSLQKQEEEEQQQDPNLKPDQVQFDDKGKQGKKGQVNVSEQTADLWMKNIEVSPADLLARKFAIEARGGKQ